MDSGIINSQFSPKVEFIDIHDHYSFNDDLICKYSLTNYEVQEGDRIAIFKLGWNYVKEYVLFEWVPRDVDDFSVTFNKLCLPKTNVEIYQFCFISGENNVLGASEPFQFCDKPKNYQSLFIKDSNVPDNTKSMTNNFSFISSTTDIGERNQEMAKIREENELLRHTLKAIVCDKTKSYDPDIQHLKKITCDLQAAVNMQQGQIKELQLKLASIKFENKRLQNDNIALQRNYTMLKTKTENVRFIKYPLDFDIGELQSLPPFPFAK